MPNQGVFRNVNIIAEITSENAITAVDIYTPGVLNPYDIVAGVKYSGFITSLRALVDINSVAEFVPPDQNPLDTEEQRSVKERERVYLTPRKSLGVFVRNATHSPIMVGEILLFNRAPYYYVPLLPYFSDAPTFDVAPDTTISLQMREVGYGLLQGSDRVSILGSAVEEAAYIEPSVLVAE